MAYRGGLPQESPRTTGVSTSAIEPATLDNDPIYDRTMTFGQVSMEDTVFGQPTRHVDIDSEITIQRMRQI